MCPKKRRYTLIHLSVFLALASLLMSLGCSTGGGGGDAEQGPPTIGLTRTYEGPSSQGAPATITPPPFGRLKVSADGQLLSDKGEEVQLRGMSSHGLQWFPELVNRDSLTALRDEWQGHVIRLAMYTAEGGYAENAAVKEELIRAANLAIELGLYVIIDWHILKDNDPTINQTLAESFFDEMALRYGRYPHVLFEIANEPHGKKANGETVNWQNSIKPYAQTIIPVIRKHAPDSIVIVGTANYGLEIQEPMADPLAFDNLLYTVHFYAGGIDPKTGEPGYLQTGVDWLQGRILAARQAGIGVFVTEWGTSGWDGGSGNDFCSAYRWVQFMETHKISWANWSISTKTESSAALTLHRNAKALGQDALSPSGRFVRAAVRGDNEAALNAVGLDSCATAPKVQPQ